MYELLGISLVLAALLSINALASLLAASLWRLLARPALRWSARTRARIIFAMRIGPPSVALLAIAALLIPAYLLNEPYSTTEVVGGKLGMLALVSALGVSLAMWRGLKSWLATRALLGQWLDGAEPIRISEVSIPAFRIEHPFPVIAVVGSFRPRLFVAGRVLESLSDEEMLAAIAHESGHLAARDNLKRIFIRACRDMLTIVPCGRSLDRAWAENAEAAADESAARQGSAVALNLASALIVIARMIPAGSRPTMPVGAFLLGNEAEGVKGRVRRLLVLAGAAPDNRPRSALRVWAPRLVVLTSMLLLALALIHSSALTEMHAAIEQAVRILS
ncbi:MAG: peptidase BlaR1 [Acidobacteria bacterium]|nr:peptidase BlaR1 [Acidobacteriota bacterium]